MEKLFKRTFYILKQLTKLPRRLHRLLIQMEARESSADALFQLEILRRMWPEAAEELLPKVTIPRDALSDIASWYICHQQPAALREAINKSLVAMAQGLVSLPISTKITLFEDALRIPSRDSPRVLSQYIAFLSQYDSNDDALLDAGQRFISLGTVIWNNEYRTAWGLYLSALIRNGEISRAKDILRRYHKHYRLTGLESIPPAALFAKQNGYSDSEIEDSARLMELIKEAENERVLERVIVDKSVAIVGSSPLESGLGRGIEIDSHDVVIRFNSAVIDSEYQNDYGRKTTIMSRNAAPLALQLPPCVEMIVLPDGLERIPFRYELIREMLQLARKGIQVCGIPLRDYRAIMVDAGFPHISTGVAVCAYIKKLIPTLSRRDLFGFSHLHDDHTVNYGDFEQFHYYRRRCDDITDTTFHIHPLSREREFLLRIFSDQTDDSRCR